MPRGYRWPRRDVSVTSRGASLGRLARRNPRAAPPDGPSPSSSTSPSAAVGDGEKKVDDARGGGGVADEAGIATAYPRSPVRDVLPHHRIARALDYVTRLSV